MGLNFVFQFSRQNLAENVGILEIMSININIKNRTEILPLAFVDDLNAIAKCGPDSKNINT